MTVNVTEDVPVTPEGQPRRLTYGGEDAQLEPGDGFVRNPTLGVRSAMTARSRWCTWSSASSLRPLKSRPLLRACERTEGQPTGSQRVRWRPTPPGRGATAGRLAAGALAIRLGEWCLPLGGEALPPWLVRGQVDGPGATRCRRRSDRNGCGDPCSVGKNRGSVTSRTPSAVRLKYVDAILCERLRLKFQRQRLAP